MVETAVCSRYTEFKKYYLEQWLYVLPIRKVVAEVTFHLVMSLAVWSCIVHITVGVIKCMLCN